ncbi:TPA: hypothetical protein DCE37_14005, partial [Candidatus Latescibacteria bacterium]|nr:hypothetical protein [Candidatus Latescibacterota bacterium]
WNGFSDIAFTKGQCHYAEFLPDSRVYTPELVVDGRVGFVGSNRTQAVGAINRVFAKPDQITIELRFDKLSDDKAVVAYGVNPIIEGIDVAVALTQRSVSTDVCRGEKWGTDTAAPSRRPSFSSVSAWSEG